MLAGKSRDPRDGAKNSSLFFFFFIFHVFRKITFIIYISHLRSAISSSSSSSSFLSAPGLTPSFQYLSKFKYPVSHSCFCANNVQVIYLFFSFLFKKIISLFFIFKILSTKFSMYVTGNDIIYSNSIKFIKKINISLEDVILKKKKNKKKNRYKFWCLSN